MFDVGSCRNLVDCVQAAIPCRVVHYGLPFFVSFLEDHVLEDKDHRIPPPPCSMPEPENGAFLWVELCKLDGVGFQLVEEAQRS